VAGLRAENPHCRWESAAFLGRNAHRGQDAIEALVGALADSEEIVRWQAARALAQQEAAHVFRLLSEALSDNDPLRRAGAAEAMGYQGGEAASVTLCKHLTDPVSRVRVAVALALSHLADPSAVPCLLPVLADEDPAVRCAAASALGRTGSPAAAKPMADALSEPAQPLLVRRALAAALVRTAHPEAQPALLAALSDSDPQVRGYAAEALGHIGDETAYAALLEASSDEAALLKGTVGSRARQALTMLERRGRRSHQTSP
jgi:HEAT repeat protein